MAPIVLTVPEDRHQPGGRQIRLALAIFKSVSVYPAPDPVVYLRGGPGAPALTAAPYLFTWVITPYLANRDVVFFDQREAGASQPALDCPEVVSPDFASLDPQLLRCRDRLVQEGVNLAGYTTAENAADVDDLRRALGDAQWNLWGVSYGARLALAVMRDFPEGIRSVILDSTLPPQINAIVEAPAKVDGALTTLFTGCAADRACNAAYPELRRVLYQTVAQLNSQPAPLTINVAGESQDITLNGDRLLVLVVQALSDTERIGALSQVIYASRAGRDYRFWQALAQENSTTARALSMGMRTSVLCGEDVHFATRAALVAADARYPEQQHAFRGLEVFTLCEQWGARPADPMAQHPVRSAIPTLVLAGQYDPQTPPAWGQLAANTLSHSFIFTFPGIGHGVLFASPCACAIAAAFLDTPAAAPDASCINKMQPLTFIVGP